MANTSTCAHKRSTNMVTTCLHHQQTQFHVCRVGRGTAFFFCSLSLILSLSRRDPARASHGIRNLGQRHVSAGTQTQGMGGFGCAWAGTRQGVAGCTPGWGTSLGTCRGSPSGSRVSPRVDAVSPPFLYVDRRNWPPGGTNLSDWGEEEEI